MVDGGGGDEDVLLDGFVLVPEQGGLEEIEDWEEGGSDV